MEDQNRKAENRMDEFEDVHIENQTQAASKKVEKEKKVKFRRERKSTKKEVDDEALKELQQKYDELNDKYLRLFSEFDNFRKRTIKEKIELSKTASEDVVTSLLTVLDDFERAIQTFAISEETKVQFEGIQLIYSKLKKILQQKGLEEIQAKEADFDTDFHEALTNIPAPDESLKGKVVDVVEKGYSLNGKIIRFAKVVVGS
jgi:molecular chaperone GrpE